MSSYLNVSTRTPTPQTAQSEIEEMKKEIAALQIKSVEKDEELQNRAKRFEMNCLGDQTG